jgi:hypothetical protein
MKINDGCTKGVGGVDGKLLVEVLNIDGVVMEESVFFPRATTIPEVER